MLTSQQATYLTTFYLYDGSNGAELLNVVDPGNQLHIVSETNGVLTVHNGQTEDYYQEYTLTSGSRVTVEGFTNPVSPTQWAASFIVKE